MNTDKEIGFLPFHALNEFMLDEYRLFVIRSVLSSLDLLPENQIRTINKLIMKHVKISGFRNSLKAPLALKLKPLARSFEKNPEVVAKLLSAWSDLNYDLQQMVYDMLIARGWEILPIDTDRTKLPGFLISWPADENFDTLFEAFCDLYPEINIPKNDVSLMTVWVCGRLPYKSNMNIQNE